MKRSATPSVFSMIKRLRFNMDEMDLYFEPEQTPSLALLPHDENHSNDNQTNEDAEFALAGEQSSTIKYQAGFPKLLFQDLQSDNPNNVLKAAQELDTMLWDDGSCPNKFQTEFLALGGHALVIAAMQKWPTQVLIQSHLCRCFAGMIMTYNRGKKSSSGESTDALVSSLLLMGVLDQITIGAVKQFPDFSSIQLDAMHALIQMCGGSTVAYQDAAKRFVRELDGVALVTKAMRAFSGDEEIQEQGCRLLNTLCITGEQEEVTAIKGMALTVVASSVQAYPDNASIEKDAHDLMNAVLCGEKSEESD